MQPRLWKQQKGGAYLRHVGAGGRRVQRRRGGALQGRPLALVRVLLKVLDLRLCCQTCMKVLRAGRLAMTCAVTCVRQLAEGEKAPHPAGQRAPVTS